jgi:hypothetical protein
MKTEYYYLVECDPDWGSRQSRDRKFHVLMKGPLSNKTLEKRLRKAASFNREARNMVDCADCFNEFMDPLTLSKIELL